MAISTTHVETLLSRSGIALGTIGLKVFSVK